LGANAYSYNTASKTYVDGVTNIQLATLKFGSYTINTNVDETNVPGTAMGGWLSLSGLSVVRDTGGSSASDLKISLTQTGYTQPGDQKSLITDFTVQAQNATSATGRQVTLNSYYDSNNAAFGESGPSNTMMVLLPQSVPASTKKTTGLSDLGGSYSITNTILIDNLGFGSSEGLTQGTVSSTVVAPAPNGLVMLAGALPFAGLLRLRRRGQTATPATAA